MVRDLLLACVFVGVLVLAWSDLRALDRNLGDQEACRPTRRASACRAPEDRRHAKRQPVEMLR